ncbi:hypothetical protein BC835DRAFT_1520203 [Cytidiella melzeri]|nr:hypothetical protein BC835DRAFT_1520203 [Cytidiella melzeri]
MFSPDPEHPIVLPYDVLVNVVACFVAIFAPDPSRYPTTKDFGHIPPQRRNRYLHKLSLVNKMLNSICGKYIFATYVLTFRAEYSAQPLALFPEDKANGNRGGFFSWNPAANPLRIAHMASKAAFIHELYIMDMGTKDLPALPESLVPDLCGALQSLSRLRVIRFHCSGERNVLHASLWNTLRELDLKTCDIRALRPPNNVEALPAIQDVFYDWNEQTTEFEKLFNPSTLFLRYQPGPYDAPPPLFKSTSKKLLHLKANYLLMHTIYQPLFDLSEVPHASVHIELARTCELWKHVPSVWGELRQTVMRAFAEGLDRYSTVQKGNLGLIISRPALAMPDIPDIDLSTLDVQPDFRPKRWDHLNYY